MNFVTPTTTATVIATPSANTLPCETCTAHTPSFGFVMVAVLVIAVFIYLAGHSKGKESVYDAIRRATTGERKGRK